MSRREMGLHVFVAHRIAARRNSAPRHRKTRRLIAGAVFLGTAAFIPVEAQQGRSLLTLLPSSGTVEMGQEFTGSLSSDDYIESGRRVQRVDYEGSQGDPFIVDLVSNDFDAYLIIVGPHGEEIASDDDSGGACHSRVSMFLEDSGTYGVIAASLSGETGSYTLRVSERQGPPIPGDCGVDTSVLDLFEGTDPQGTLSLADMPEVTGTLDSSDTAQDGEPLEVWAVSGEAGQRVVIDLMSRDFDTMLFVAEPGGYTLSSDDDSGGACNSRLEIRLGDEPHLIGVRSWSSSAGGAFTLRVSEQAGPMSDLDCPGF